MCFVVRLFCCCCGFPYTFAFSLCLSKIFLHYKMQEDKFLKKLSWIYQLLHHRECLTSNSPVIRCRCSSTLASEQIPFSNLPVTKPSFFRLTHVVSQTWYDMGNYLVNCDNTWYYLSRKFTSLFTLF